MDTKPDRPRKITMVFKLDESEYLRAEPYIGGYKNRGLWAKNAFLEKAARYGGERQKSPRAADGNRRRLYQRAYSQGAGQAGEVVKFHILTSGKKSVRSILHNRHYTAV